MSATWSIAATVLEPIDVIENFVAHHLVLGAAHVTLFFDDPEDPAIGVVEGLDHVTAVRCDADFWSGGRPDAQEARQKRNAQLAYRDAKADWFLHIDGDELAWAARPISEHLAGIEPTEDVVRLAPAEFMSKRRNPDISLFRLALPKGRKGDRIGHAAYGREYPILQQGLLSHTVGKFFLRTGRPDLVPDIHVPWKQGQRADYLVQDAIRLLHFHGQSEDRWVSQVEGRLRDGAYREMFRDHRRRSGKVDGRGLNAHLVHLRDTGGEPELRNFHRRVAAFAPEKRVLGRAGVLLRVRLWLPEKVATIFGRPAAVSDLAQNPATGELEGTADFRGIRLRIGLERNYTEIRLAQGIPYEEEELGVIEALTHGRTVDFWDIGANAGMHSLAVAMASGPKSTITAFEPNPEMAERFRRNLAETAQGNINLHELALGPADGTVTLNIPHNPGQASILDGAGGTAVEVPMRRLADFVGPRRPGRLRVFKIDIEGAEPLCLAPFFEGTPDTDWPDVILYEHAHADRWSLPPEQLFPRGFYRVERVFDDNTLLVRADGAVRAPSGA